LARANLLTTSTPDYQGLVGNGKVFRVPAYQRDYAWGEENWEDLWEDIQQLRLNPELQHYMGAIVVDSKNKQELVVIDGQQRLATLAIFSLAVISEIVQLANSGVDAVNNLERAATLRNKYVGEKDPASLMESSKLKLNQNDDPFFQEYLIQMNPPLHPKALRGSNKLLWNCFEFFKVKLAELPIADRNGESYANLLNRDIAQRLLFIQISVDDEMNAYTVFETLNARGLELSATDLLKNYLYSLVKTPADIGVIQQKWKRLIGIVNYDKFPEFLRYYLLCSQRQVRKQRLFKTVKDLVTSAISAFDLLEKLEMKAPLYRALFDHNDDFWETAPECKAPVRDLNLFRVTQFTPVFLSAWGVLKDVEFKKLLDLVVAFSFRYNVVCKLNTNQLEPLSQPALRVEH
jgi:uncharacterized protein with ParB-like and HNH nuclease domain